MTPDFHVSSELTAMPTRFVNEIKGSKPLLVVNCAGQSPNFHNGTDGVDYIHMKEWVDVTGNAEIDQKNINGEKLTDLMYKQLQRITDHINGGNPILFHCIEGKSRSVIMASLVKTILELEKNPSLDISKTLRRFQLYFYLKRGFADSDEITSKLLLENAVEESKTPGFDRKTYLTEMSTLINDSSIMTEAVKKDFLAKNLNSYTPNKTIDKHSKHFQEALDAAKKFEINLLNPQVNTDDTTISRILSFNINALEAQDIPVTIEDNGDTKLVVLVPNDENSEPIFFNPEHLKFKDGNIEHPYRLNTDQFEIWSCTLKNGETTLSDIKHLTDDEYNELHDNNTFENMYAQLNRLMGGESILPSDMQNISSRDDLIRLGSKLNKSIDLTNNDKVTNEIKNLISTKLKEYGYTNEKLNRILESTEYLYSNLVLLINDDIQAGAAESPAAGAVDTRGDRAFAEELAAAPPTIPAAAGAAGAAATGSNQIDTRNDEALARALAGQNGHNTHEAGAARASDTGIREINDDENLLDLFFENELKNEMGKWGPNFNLDIFLQGYQTQQEKDLITKIYNRLRQNQQ